MVDSSVMVFRVTRWVVEDVESGVVVGPERDLVVYMVVWWIVLMVGVTYVVARRLSWVVERKVVH